MIDIKSMSLEELKKFLAEINEPAFRAQQIFKWLHSGVCDFSEMTNLSKSLREKLSSLCYIASASLARKQVSSQDGTIKYLWRMADGNCVESVYMEYHHGNTVCLSTQVGCRMGCAFCASTMDGLVRNLTASEIEEQILQIQRDTGNKITNIVLMGTGEPLDNYDNVIRFLHLVNHPMGLNIGMRHISLSTCGVCDKIKLLAKEKLGITLSISLHAPEDEVRSKIMPINRKYNLENLISACKYYFKETSRRISFEYTMIDGVSDTDRSLHKLGKLLSGFQCHVNLIPLNPVSGRTYKPSSRNRIEKFKSELEKYGVTVTIRRSLGSDIDAACGQLKRAVAAEMQERGDV